MDVILLERIGKLGQMGDVVRVKDGYARNFLLPRGKALRATADNKSKFEGMKEELKTQSLERKGEAGKEGTVMHAAFILAGDGISSNRFEHRSRLHVHAGDVAVFDLRQ